MIDKIFKNIAIYQLQAAPQHLVYGGLSLWRGAWVSCCKSIPRWRYSFHRLAALVKVNVDTMTRLARVSGYDS